MTAPSEAIRQHHRELLATLEWYATAVTRDPQGLVEFLTRELLPHAQGEERHLYPVVEPLLHATHQATATMRIDHSAIAALIQRLGEVARAVPDAPPSERTQLERSLQRLALQLEAIFRLHLEKEERVYLPLFEQHLPADVQQRVLDAMHEVSEPGADGAPSAETVLDVRQVPPPQRHPLIFETFGALAPGQSFVLVNDHDPKPLYYQFAFERAGQFTWTYLEEGPETWRVRIGRA